MTQTLPQMTHEHHERLLVRVDAMPTTADLLLTADTGTSLARLDETVAFLRDTLLPHVAASETTLYPELERMFQNRHSMAPMRREHEEVRRLVAALADLVGVAHAKGLTIGRVLEIRRVMFQLYAILKIHLAEEEAILRLLDRGVTEDVAELLTAAMAHPGIDPA
jgi:wyosine [tRNA(Phe)-imidazoG37] synthetase (radical SAM superfamily)